MVRWRASSYRRQGSPSAAIRMMAHRLLCTRRPRLRHSSGRAWLLLCAAGGDNRGPGLYFGRRGFPPGSWCRLVVTNAPGFHYGPAGRPACRSSRAGCGSHLDARLSGLGGGLGGLEFGPQSSPNRLQPRLLPRSLVRSLSQSLTRSLARSHARSLARPFTHPFTRPARWRNP